MKKEFYLFFEGKQYPSFKRFCIDFAYYLGVSESTIKNKVENPESLTLREIEILRSTFNTDYNNIIGEFKKISHIVKRERKKEKCTKESEYTNGFIGFRDNY